MIDHWFPTSIWITKSNCVDKIEDIKSSCWAILNDLDKNIDKNPFVESHLKSSFWHDSYGHLDTDDRFSCLKNIIQDQAISFLTLLGFPGITYANLRFTNMWVNLIEANDYHALHQHGTTGKSYISGVYYVTSPSNATINFSSPYMDAYEPLPPYMDNENNFKMARYFCTPGNLIMFRSYVYHGYDSHKSSEPKISIPFNIAVE